MINSGFFEILSMIFVGLISSIPYIFTLIISIYYRKKTGSKKDSTLLILGNIILILCSISQTISTIFIRSWGTEIYTYFIYSINGISFLASILFTIGFLLLVRKMVKYKLQSA